MFFVDRIATKPNRYLVTPENGDTPYYVTLTRADEPVVDGTPINATALNRFAQIAEIGDNGVWNYIKWENGLVELWGIKTREASEFSAVSGGYESSFESLLFPFNVTKMRPVITATNECVAWLNNNNEFTNNAVGVSYSLKCTNQPSTDTTVIFYVSGFWK